MIRIDFPEGDRADRRLAALREQGLAWLEQQGMMRGFPPQADGMRIDGHDQHQISRKGAARWIAHPTIDYEGILTVSNPDALLTAVGGGLGSAKAYGCGLLLVHRA